MSDAQERPVVFIDTSYLRQKAKSQAAEWNKLLRLSRDRQVDLHIPHIAIEEYRTQCRDHLVAKIEKSKGALQKLEGEWVSNPVTEKLGDPIESDIFPDSSRIEDESVRTIERLVKDNRINILMPAESHGVRVWKKYFSWTSIFCVAVPRNRDERSVRDSRRKQIPDAWIYEAAVDLANNNELLLCLCTDDGLSDRLQEHQISIFSSAESVVKIVEGDDTKVVLTEQTPEEGEVAERHPEEIAEKTPLTDRLSKIAESEWQIQRRILGYAHWFAPISKENLSDLLQEKGHAAREIENAAHRLVIAELLEDSGTHYLLKDLIIGKEAAGAVMDEVIDKIIAD
ncbi:PIN domain-containing protein [Woeseia oceani]|uniref:DUF4935 domain-containing protein n=1 Tax=Woeseia oceani TaxID=1548547 RepID=A0A193LC06_9GAMM|nr:PIN domain-containing protein [Woeseia oceani]ANO50065.1 hypothetical protein BA177_01460 [Woeseia oceani]